MAILALVFLFLPPTVIFVALLWFVHHNEEREDAAWAALLARHEIGR